MLNKLLFNAFLCSLNYKNFFKNNCVTDVTDGFLHRLQKNPFKINRVTDVTDVTAKNR